MTGEVLQVNDHASSALDLAAIRQDGGTQMREALSENIIVQYADFVGDGVQFPPVVVFYDGQDYWLADGFHRVKAHALAGQETIRADVRSGSRLNAVRYAIGANATNGKPRTSGDLARAYRCAVDNGLSPADDTDAVQALLHCSSRWARELTRAAREQMKSARDRKIQRMADEGGNQKDIAKAVGVNQATVSRVVDYAKRNPSEMHNADSTIPSIPVSTKPEPQPEPAPEEFEEVDDYEDFDGDEDLEEEEETAPPNHETGTPAHCKYCGNSHSDWDYTADVISDSGHGWICGICDHCTADEDMEKAREEEEEEEPAHNHRAQGTGENEWYTPAEYLVAARAVLGEIDLDPASSVMANETVGATQFFTIEDDGLGREWSGKVYLNPPYSQPAIAQFSEKLASECENGNVREAIALTHNYTDTAWFHRLASTCQAICFTRGRIGFVNPEGKKAAPTQGQAFFYFGADSSRFAEQFKAIGFVVEVRQ